MLTRRAFVAAAAGLAGAASIDPTAQGQPAPKPATATTPAGPAPSTAIDALYRRAHIVDTTTISGPGFAVDEAISAGLTATVCDLSIYPRTYASAIRALAEWNAALARPDARFIKVLRAADIDTAKTSRRLGIVLACQDAAILDSSSFSVNDSNLVNLQMFFDLGLRVLQMTHNERNGVGDAFREKRDAGLSRLGEAVVARMNALGMLVDLAHCSDNTTLDAIALSSRPVIISHAGCRALYDTRRNKPDDQIRALADKGGVFGVFNMTLWMTDKPTATIETVVDHIDHAVKVGGVEHVAFGNDQPILRNDTPPDVYLEGMRSYARRNVGMPGAERMPDHTMAYELNEPARLLRLAAALDRRGYREPDIEKIIGGNFVRLFREVCG